MNITGMIRRGFCILNGVAIAMRYSILAKASSVEQILNSSNDNNTDILLNPDGSNASEWVKEHLNLKENTLTDNGILGGGVDDFDTIACICLIAVICSLLVRNWRKTVQADRVMKIVIVIICILLILKRMM